MVVRREPTATFNSSRDAQSKATPRVVERLYGGRYCTAARDRAVCGTRA